MDFETTSRMPTLKVTDPLPYGAEKMPKWMRGQLLADFMQDIASAELQALGDFAETEEDMRDTCNEVLLVLLTAKDSVWANGATSRLLDTAIALYRQHRQDYLPKGEPKRQPSTKKCAVWAGTNTWMAITHSLSQMLP